MREIFLEKNLEEGSDKGFLVYDSSGPFSDCSVEVDVLKGIPEIRRPWIEKRLERAAEHYKRATEIDPEEPRAWHNLAICNYHLALKRNPENIKGAVQSAYAALEMAKEKGGSDYKAPDKTLEFFALQLGWEPE